MGHRSYSVYHDDRPPAPLQRGRRGIGSVIFEGIAFGIGNSIAHRAVDAIMGPRTIQHEHLASEGPSAATSAPSVASDSCGMQIKSFQDCLSKYSDDITKCQFYMDMLSQCRRNSGSTINA